MLDIAESPKQDRKRFNSITKTIQFAYLVKLFIYDSVIRGIKRRMSKNFITPPFPQPTKPNPGKYGNGFGTGSVISISGILTAVNDAQGGGTEGEERITSIVLYCIYILHTSSSLSFYHHSAEKSINQFSIRKSFTINL